MNELFKDTKIWCISLIERDDRYECALNEFKKVGITAEFHRPTRNPISGAMGCFLAHKYCLENSDGKNVLIFEDDVKFSNKWREKIPQIHEFLQDNDEYDTLRLGIFMRCVYKHKRNTKYISKCKGTANHAVLYNKKFVTKLLTRPDFDGSLPIDDYLVSLPEYNDFSFIDNMCYQRSIASDNLWANVFEQGILQSYYVYEPWQYLINSSFHFIFWLPPRVQEKICFVNISDNIMNFAAYIYSFYGKENKKGK